MAQRQDHYEVLGVTPDARDEVIRAAYRVLVAKCHPDRNPGDRDAELKLKRLNAAFRVLGDREKRKQYDELTRSPEASDKPQEDVPKGEPAQWKASGEGSEPQRKGPRWGFLAVVPAAALGLVLISYATCDVFAQPVPKPTDVDVIDKATGQITQLSAAQAIGKWKAGEVDLVRGQQYNVRMPTGAYSAFPAEQLGEMVNRGGTLVSANEVQISKGLEERLDRRGKLVLPGILLLFPWSALVAWRLLRRRLRAVIRDGTA